MKKQFFLISLLFLFTANLLFAQWNIQTVDNSGDVGRYSDIAYDSNGYPHIVYVGSSSYEIKYAKWTPQGWQIEILRNAHIVEGCCRIKIDKMDNVHIAYCGDYSDRYYRLWYAVKYAQINDWIISLVNSEYSYTTTTYHTHLSLALTYDSEQGQYSPHIIYALYSGGTYSLYYTFYKLKTATWSRSIIDSGNSVGLYSSMAIDSKGNVYVSYYNATQTDLKFAYFNGNSWGIHTVDGAGSDVGQYTSLVLDENEIPHISYYDATQKELKHAKVNRK